MACFGKRSIFLLLLFLGVGGCTSKYVDGGAVEADYKKGVKEWSGEAELYELFKTRILARATYKSLDYRRAFVDYYSEVYLLNPEQKEEMWERHQQAWERTEEFFLEVFTPNFHLNNLEEPQPFWRVFIEDSFGDRHKPIRVESMTEPREYIETFYPYVSQWSRFYTVYFPKLPRGGAMKLILTSSVGRVEIPFKSQ